MTVPQWIKNRLASAQPTQPPRSHARQGGSQGQVMSPIAKSRPPTPHPRALKAPPGAPRQKTDDPSEKSSLSRQKKIGTPGESLEISRTASRTRAAAPSESLAPAPAPLAQPAKTLAQPPKPLAQALAQVGESLAQNLSHAQHCKTWREKHGVAARAANRERMKKKRAAARQKAAAEAH